MPYMFGFECCGTGSSNFEVEPLSWNARMKIALGAAKALAFLHNEAQLIFRDFKSSNILLDSVSETFEC